MSGAGLRTHLGSLATRGLGSAATLVATMLAVSGAAVPGARAATPVASNAVRAVRVAGSGSPGFSGDGGPASRARLDHPEGIALDASGDLFIATGGNCRVREVPSRATTAYGIVMRAHDVYTVAGTGCAKGTGAIGEPTGVAVDDAGDLYIVVASANRVLEVRSSGRRRLGSSARARLVSVAVGSGVAGYGGDGGPAGAAQLDHPQGIALDATGDLIIATTQNCRVREVPSAAGTHYGVAMRAGDIYTIAGNGTCGIAGVGGPALDAAQWLPDAVALDSDGDLLISERGAGWIDELAAAQTTAFGVAIGEGDVDRVAGTGVYSAYLIDGLSARGTTAELNEVNGLAISSDGTLVASDTSSAALRAVPDAAGTLFGRAVSAGAMYTVAGALPAGPNYDSSKWIVTRMTAPFGVAWGPTGALYYSDEQANVVDLVAASGE